MLSRRRGKRVEQEIEKNGKTRRKRRSRFSTFFDFFQLDAIVLIGERFSLLSRTFRLPLSSLASRPARERPLPRCTRSRTHREHLGPEEKGRRRKEPRSSSSSSTPRRRPLSQRFISAVTPSSAPPPPLLAPSFPFVLGETGTQWTRRRCCSTSSSRVRRRKSLKRPR